jgi:phenylalanyl-tRNA synthetase beta chain
MTISYNWLSEYLPVSIDPERLSKILTSIGLEVESLEKYEEVKGGMKGLLIGEVLEAEKHPNADKLSLTKVTIGSGEPLQIVCGAPNVAAGQKVVVATVGTTIYPFKGDPLTMKVAKIRGVESYGMICAEDEIGLTDNHAGILVLPSTVKVGSAAADYFKPYSDWVYEIGLTPNRMDAMSHLGVARDVCAYLIHHDKKEYRVKSPFVNGFKAASNSLPVSVVVENTEACHRYSGVSISGVTVKESPLWLKQKLKSIGQRPINNIVDITNYILHETGQPLHAFNADAIKGKKIIVKNLPAGTKFTTLDEKERSLHAADLMICNGDGEGMCIAGVFGGLESGVNEKTTNLFLESAWFNPVDIRKTSFRHGLRTDAATRFEKNTDISNTVNVLKRAALLITEICGGQIASEIVDIYPEPKPKTQVTLKFHYLKKLSGKNYHSDAVKKILTSLGFEIMREGIDDLLMAVPYSKPDISLQADVVEEIMRIDGLDNIEIPTSITISPSVETFGYKHVWKEKVANYLAGLGFNEIFTNSITNAAYFTSEDLVKTVRLLNNLSAEHNIMRPSMLETGLESVAHNLNRKNNDLQFFEFGKTYSTSGPGKYDETDHLCLYVTGNSVPSSWKGKGQAADLYYLKGVVGNLLQLTGIRNVEWSALSHPKLHNAMQVSRGRDVLMELGMVQAAELKNFDIRQPVLFADIKWETVLKLVHKNEVRASELPKQLPVYRDLAMIVPSSLPYNEVEKTVKTVRVDKLQEMRLFDIFESEKLGKDKKSLAVSFTFLDPEKTLTDKEIDTMMSNIMTALEKQLNAEIRKQ